MLPAEPFRPRRADWLQAAAVAVALFVLYAATAPRSVALEDDGLFILSSYFLGIEHPPGYPLFTWFGHLFTYLPFGSVAYRVHLASAMFGALTCAALWLCARSLIDGRLPAYLAAFALGVSPVFWSQAIIAEVYTPGAAFAALVWAALLAWHRTGSRAALLLAGLCGGLSLGVHSTVALLAPAVVLFLWLGRKRRSNFWPAAILGAAIGTLLYLLAFVAVDLHAPPANIFNAAYGPARSSWNLSQADLDSPIERMIFIGTGTQWRGAMFGAAGKLPGRLLEYVGALPREFAWLTIVLIVCGLGLLLWREPPLGWLFVTALLIQSAFALTYQIGDYYVFYITGYLLMAMLAAYAAAQIAQWLATRPFRGARLLATAALLATLAVGIWPQLAHYWKSVRFGAIPFIDVEDYPVGSQTETIYRVAEGVVGQLPPDAIVFVPWEQLYTYYYAAHIAQARLDLRFVEPVPHADRPGLPASTIDFIRANIATHPIFFTQPRGEVETAGYSFRVRYVRFTPLYEVQQK